MPIDISQVVGLVIGALIAGLVGVVTTILSDRLSRREEHRKKLLANLGRLQPYLKTVLFLAWPPLQNGYEGANLPLPWEAMPEDKVARGENEAVDFLKHFKLMSSSVYPALSIDKIDETVYVRKELIYDLKNHFPTLYEHIMKWEDGVRQVGPNLRTTYYKIVTAIYDEVRNRGLLPSQRENPRWPLEITNNVYYACQLMFNLVLKLPESKWPNAHEQYIASPDKQMMDSIVETVSAHFNAEKIESQLKDMVNSFYSLRDDIDKVVVSDDRLTGRCQLSRV